MNKYVKLSFIMLFLLISVLSGCDTASEQYDYTESVNTQYIIQDISVGAQQKFRYEIYSITGQTMDSGIIENAQPYVSGVSNNILKLSVPYGTNAVSCTYYDVQNNRISEAFQNPIIENDEVVAYFSSENNEKKLIIHWLFENRQKEYPSDFSGAYGQVEDASISDHLISVTYISGDNYDVKTVEYSF